MNANLYRAAWRWHFYAGLIILPLLVWLAVTGGLYLYKAEIERALYHQWIVLPTPLVPLSLAEMKLAVEQQTAGEVTQIARPAADGESWRLAFTAPDGAERMAFVRPDTGLVMGIARAGGPMELLKHLHSLTVAGPAGNIVIEIVAGWAAVLVLTGFYLWWPRAGSRALSLAGRVGERRFWRNLHASAGALVGVILLFLAVTGMPWTYFWGARFHAFVAAQEIGRPKPVLDEPGAHDDHLPWSLRGRPMPIAAGHGDIGPDAAIAAAGLSAPWVLDLPREAGQPYRIAPTIDRARDARVIYVEPASGRILLDARFAEFGIGAKAFEWGIYTHQGQEYGEPNRLVMLAGCVGTVLLAVTAPVLWWKRRRAGRLSAPPRAMDPRKARGVAAVMLGVGLLFPLTGLTMVVALVGEWVVARFRSPHPPIRSG